MLEKLSWEFFELTGNIETFLEYTKIKDLNNSDKGNNDVGDDN